MNHGLSPALPPITGRHKLPLLIWGTDCLNATGSLPAFRPTWLGVLHVCQNYCFPIYARPISLVAAILLVMQHDLCLATRAATARMVRLMSGKPVTPFLSLSLSLLPNSVRVYTIH